MKGLQEKQKNKKATIEWVDGGKGNSNLILSKNIETL